MTTSKPRGLALRIAGNNLLAALGLNRRVRVALSEDDGLTFVTVPGRQLAIPAPGRWTLYKRGWSGRSNLLVHHFGLSDVVHIAPGEVAIEIGANIGEFTLALANTGAVVYAIEGDPHVFRCLTVNTQTCANVKCLQHVIWNTDEEISFFSEPTDANSSIYRPDEGVESLEIKLQAVTLDGLTARLGIGDIAFLKCDAEGAEPEVIEGARETLARTRTVAFDTGAERMGQSTTTACEALLAGMGFDVRSERRARRQITFGVRR
ncbi:MAG: FkbM family methyltransferase [Gemmobacter sp.]